MLPEGVTIKGVHTPAASSRWTIATTNDLTAWSGPWGISFVANLTSDTNTGLRRGVDGRSVYQSDNQPESYRESRRAVNVSQATAACS